MKKLITSSIVLIALVNFSCNKEEVKPISPTDGNRYSGYFLTDYNSGIYGTTFSYTEADIIVEITADDDSVYFMDYSVPIDQNGQEHFNLYEEDGSGGYTDFNISYTQNFSKVSVYGTIESGTGGPTIAFGYNGDCTFLHPKEHQHDSKVGLWIVSHYLTEWSGEESNIDWDSTYTDTLWVEPFENGLMIGPNSIWCTDFYTYYSFESSDLNKTISWTDNTLDALHATTWGVSGSLEGQTHSYTATKL